MIRLKREKTYPPPVMANNPLLLYSVLKGFLSIETEDPNHDHNNGDIVLVGVTGGCGKKSIEANISLYLSEGVLRQKDVPGVPFLMAMRGRIVGCMAKKIKNVAGRRIVEYEDGILFKDWFVQTKDGKITPVK